MNAKEKALNKRLHELENKYDKLVKRVNSLEDNTSQAVRDSIRYD